MAELIPAWTARDARQFLCAPPRVISAWKTLRSVFANMQKEIAAGRHASFEAYLAEPERLQANNDQRGFHKHVKSTAGLEGSKARSD